MSTLDSSITHVALPTLVRAFHIDLVEIKWIVIAYLLAVTGFLLPFGRLSDLYGRRRVFGVGFFVFIFGSALCGFSESFAALVTARVIQGIGASALMANGPALITAAFPSKERGQALGLLSVIVSAGLISGPGIGGLLLGQFGWSSIFFVNLPIGLFGLGMTLFQMKVDPDSREISRSLQSFDWMGTVLQLIVLSLYILLIDQPVFGQIFQGMPELFPYVIGALLVVASGALITRELNAKRPVVDFTLFRIRNFWTASAASFFLMFAYSILTVLFPFYFQEALGFEPKEVGVWLSVIPMLILVVAPIAGKLSDLGYSKILSLFGSLTLFTILIAGSLGFGVGWQFELISTQVAILLAIVGVGLALFQSPNNACVMSCVPKDRLGGASALVATLRNLGMLTGAGLGTNWMNNQLGKGYHFLQAFQATLAFAALFAAFAAVACMAKIGDRRVTQERE